MLRRFLADEGGLTAVEYGLLVTFLGLWGAIGLDASGLMTHGQMRADLR
jgi:Flp pilus assembly pilin Flp